MSLHVLYGFGSGIISTYRLMDREDSKKVGQTDPDVDVELHSDPGQSNKDAPMLS